MMDPNDPRPAYLQEHYDPRPEEQKPNYGYNPTPKRVPEPYEIPQTPPSYQTHYQTEVKRREVVIKMPSGGSGWVFGLGVLFIILFMIITPIYISAVDNYRDEVVKSAYVDWSSVDFMDPSTYPDDPEIPDPSWFVDRGDTMLFYIRWIGILLLFGGIYMRRGKND